MLLNTVRRSVLLSTASLLTTIVLMGCMSQYRYDIVRPSDHPRVSADSLRWEYTNGVVTGLWVGSDEQRYWLSVTPKTILEVRTMSNETFRFYLQSLRVTDHGEGVLGATTSWSGYDTRQHVERTVLLREVDRINVISGHPANAHIGRSR